MSSTTAAAVEATPNVWDSIGGLELAVDALWISLATYLVFFMQSGFALLELGSVRAKNAQNILLKNLLDCIVAGISFWLIGYGIAYGNTGDEFVGRSNYGGTSFNKSDTHFRDWLFQWAFAGTAATIVSGALAERTNIGAYALFSTMMTTMIYPFIVHWTWGGGFLASEGYVDFAGSGIVHLCGGTAAFWGAYFVGPRLGRFDKNATENFNPHSIPFVVTGVFILWFGWYGFNCGSTLGIHGDNTQLISKVGMTTTIGGCAGGLTGFALEVLWAYVSSLSEESSDQKKGLRLAIAPGLTNGLLAGLVAVTAGCAFIEPWSAFIIGILGAVCCTGWSKLLQWMHIDDPLDASSVHGAGGLWGVLATGLFHEEDGAFFRSGGHLLGIQILSIIVIIGWTSAWSIIVFGSARWLGKLRVPKNVELLGLDEWEHGGSAYAQQSGNLTREERLKEAKQRANAMTIRGSDDTMRPTVQPSRDEVELGENTEKAPLATSDSDDAAVTTSVVAGTERDDSSE